MQPNEGLSFAVKARFGAALGALLTLMFAASLSAKPAERMIAASEKITVEASGKSGALKIQVNAPKGGEAPSVSITNDDNYVWWSSPLKGDGGVWTAPLDRNAVESLLIGTKVVVTFPKSQNGEDLIVSTPAPTVRPSLATAKGIVEGTPLFFKEPTAPEPPKVPAADAKPDVVQKFAFDAIDWDRRMTAFNSDFSAAVSRARSLWIDLVTAKRIPWLAENVHASDPYATLEAKKGEVAKSRDQFQREATGFVQSWNSAHAQGGTAPVTLKFDQA
jgi:hypothetical protein